ncbi:hypothetical protein LCC91_03780 [Tepidimonas taiwanensis]|uniref:Uncharacterized protein n=1 Tax=Tepidimonas taiwanensis TaxID=307486 RepID=A0A554X6Z0_9BURK|nr:hypothetical protein [Tepidimonas taiwanensis]MCX7692348.1 hypothetical protein [Tepidimonas taiwanensis]TSE31526.1 hypothetical protein Ttaiw_01480 [Tepidimonas taiwanensis]UBQ06232.1 hypothetical protein LCC91_03780 [Tepidimonas taiwanensis]
MTTRGLRGSRLAAALLIGAVVAALAGCAGTSAPAWRIETRNRVEQATAAALTGRTRVAEQQWRLAAQAAAAAAQADVLARIALARCAVETVVLRGEGCAAAEPYLPDAGAAERAYAAYLGVPDIPASAGDGSATAVHEALPVPHRPIARLLAEGAPPAALTPALAAIEDPLARLVAGAVAWRAGRLDAEGVALLVDTASAEGWRQPLAVWLGVQARLADAAGDVEGAARARRRLQWVLGETEAARPVPASPSSLPR